MRTQVGIVGAGPAGLLLSHLLHRAGIASVVLERQNREHVEHRIRAGVLEQGTAELLRATGLGQRLDREGMVHRGIEIAVRARRHRIDLAGLSGGKTVTVYGQHEVVKDLIDRRLADGGDLRFEAEEVQPAGFLGETPSLSWSEHGERRELRCDFIAGCDGFHGICRPSLPAGHATELDRSYPFAWLGILAEAPPAQEELIYAHHPDGFALFSMRSPQITRLYLQCDPDEDLANWPDRRIWDELHKRLESDGGWHLKEGPILQKGITAMRSFVCEPMQAGRLFLAGDAAHIVPPTGAKGMNLAVADVRVLAAALIAYYRESRDDLLAAYSATCLRRVWKVQRFSWWMTQLLHRFPEHDAFGRHLQQAELDYVVHSEAARRSLAENYVGLPFEGAGE
ncbi:MAG TPA: 4-hydroxybenzoate 3-monooxygenase [Kiloniellales bacterium]|nr:4-hydroxybenzoate 3-monooxygenase [Kiloniellales bacterium]